MLPFRFLVEQTNKPTAQYQPRLLFGVQTQTSHSPEERVWNAHQHLYPVRVIRGLPDANLLPGPFKRPTQANRQNQNTPAEQSDVAEAKQSEPCLICQ
jgi:hypothetical protein